MHSRHHLPNDRATSPASDHNLNHLFWGVAATLLMFLLGVSSVDLLLIRPLQRSITDGILAQSGISLTDKNLLEKPLLDC